MKPQPRTNPLQFILKRFKLTALTVGALWACGSFAQAQVNGLDAWNSAGGTNVNWSGGGNWTGTNTPPLSKDTLIFGLDNSTGTGLGDVLTDNLTVGGAASWIFTNISFLMPSPGYTINPGTAFGQGPGAGFTLGTAAAGTVLVQSNNATVTINDNITLGNAVQTFSLAGSNNVGGNLTLGGVVSGPGGLTKTGPGVLTLNNVETYAGATTVSAGVLTIGSGGLLSSTGVPGTYAGAISVSGATNNLNSTGAQTFTGVISGTGVINVNAGSVTLTASNTFSGKLTVNSGAALIVNSSGTLLGSVTNTAGTSFTEKVLTTGGQWITTNLTFVGSTALALNFTNALSPSVPPLQVNGPISFGSGVSLTVNGSTNLISGATYPLITATRGITGTAPTTANGNVTLNLPVGVTATVVQSGNTINLVVSQGTLNNAVDTWSPSGLTANWTGTGSSANWTGGNTPPITGDGLIFGSDSSAGGATTPVADTLNDNLTIGGPAVWTFTNITFTGNAPAFTFTPAIAGGQGPGAGFTLGTGTAGTVINQNSGSAQTINEPIALAAANQTISLAGGNLTVSALVSGAGGLILNANGETGVLTLTNNAATGETYTGPTVVGSGQLNLGPFVNGGTSGIGQSSSLTISNGATVSVLSGNGLAGSTIAIGSLPVTNSGTLTFDGGNGNDSAHIRGVLTLNGGTLGDLNGGGSEGAFGSWDLDDGVVVIGTATATISALDVIPDQSGGTIFNVAVTGGTPDLDVSGTLIDGTSTADTGIIKQGNGTMQLDGVETYAGPTTISAGTLTINTAARLGGTAGTYAGLITNNGVLNYNGNGPQTFSGAIRGTGVLNVNSGTLTLSGANAYSGATTVANGANLTVLSGGGGRSAISMASSTIFSNSVTTSGGQWGLTNNLTFTDNTSVLALNFNNNTLSTTVAPVAINGTLTFGSSADLVVYGNSLLGAGTYPLITATSIAGTAPTTANGGATINLVGVTATIVQSGNTINLVVSSGTAPLTWDTGSASAGTWDTTSANWLGGAVYANGDSVTFGDGLTGPGPITVTLNSLVTPSGITFSNTAKNYILSGTGGISGPEGLIEKGSGTLTISTTNAFTGPTIVTNGGTLTLDFSHGATASIISGSSALSLGSATLNVVGSSTVANDQPFNGTTLSSGPAVINASGPDVPEVDLGALTFVAGSSIVLDGPETTNGTEIVSATADITTTTTESAPGGLIQGANGTANNVNTVNYATVGLYDWAATTGSSPYTIVGGSQVPGFYFQSTAVQPSIPINSNFDVTTTNVQESNLFGQGGSRYYLASVRFNVPQPVDFTIQYGQAGHNGNPFNCGGVLVTPAVGTNNITIDCQGTDGWNDSTGTPLTLVWQNNTLGELIWDQSQRATTDTIIQGSGYEQNGPGTVSFLGLGGYTVGTFLNGGVLEIAEDASIGGIFSGTTVGTVNSPVTLNGGTLLANFTGNLDDGTSTSAGEHPIVLGVKGGGVAATTGNKLTVDGVVSGGGPLIIGIPPSSANGNVAGLLPGTGLNTANPTNVLATGTVALTGANTATGGTVLDSGILNVSGLAALPAGGLTFNGGTFQWIATTPDISTLPVTLGAGGGTLDVNGHSVTLANSIGNGGSGGLTVASTTAGGILTLTGANTYTGNTTVSVGTLLVNNTTGSATGSGNVTVAGIAGFGGAGTISGNLTLQTGATILLTEGSPLTIGGTVALNNNAVTVTIPGNTALGVGQYTLATYTAAGSSGSFNSIPALISGAGLVAGTAGSISTSGGVVTLTVTLTGVSDTWAGASGANWSVLANWPTAIRVPSLAGDGATFGTGSGGAVTLDASETVGSITFNNPNSYQIGYSANTLTVDNKGLGGAGFSVTAGTTNVIQSALSLNQSVSSVVGSGASLALAGNVVNGTAVSTLAVEGTGTTALSGVNTYGPAAGTVGTTVTGGATLQVGGNHALGAGDVSVSGSQLQVGVTGLSLANNVTLGVGTTTVDNNGGHSATLAGTLSGVGNLSAANSGTGSGTLTLSGANSYTGSTTIGAGAAVSIAADSGLGADPVTATINVILNGGDLLGNTTLTLSGNRNIGIGPVSGATGATGYLDAATSQTLTVNGLIGTAGNSGADNLTVNGVAASPGTVVLTAANPLNGTTTVAGGELQLANALALQNSTVNVTAGTLDFGTLTTATLGGLSGPGNVNLANDAAAAVALNLGNDTTTATYSGLLSGIGSLDVVGGGNITIGSGTSGGAEYTGTTEVDNGTLTLGGVGIMNAPGNLEISGNPGVCNAIVADNAVAVFGGSILLANGASSPSVATLVVKNNASLSAAALNFGSDVGRVPTGSFVTVQDHALLSLSGSFDINDALSTTANNDTLNLNGGTLAVGNLLASEGSATHLSYINFNGGVLAATASDPGGSAFLPVLTGVTVNVTNALVPAFINSSTNTITIAATLAGGGDAGLVKQGTGTLILSGANTYSGLTTVSNGTLLISGALNNSAENFTVNDGKSFGAYYNAATPEIGSLTLGQSSGASLVFSNLSSTTSAAFHANYVDLNGTTKLVITDAANLTAPNEYPLIQIGGGIVTNSGQGFSLTLPGGVTGTLTNDPSIIPGYTTLALIVKSIVAYTPPVTFTGVTVSGTGLVLSATGGNPNDPVSVLSTTNLTLPLAQWTTVTSGNYDGNGNFTYTVSGALNSGFPQQFYIIKGQ